MANAPLADAFKEAVECETKLKLMWKLFPYRFVFKSEKIHDEIDKAAKTRRKLYRQISNIIYEWERLKQELEENDGN